MIIIFHVAELKDGFEFNNKKNKKEVIMEKQNCNEIVNHKSPTPKRH
jgi:hypothetical protein